MNSGAETVQERFVLTSRVAALETLSLNFATLVCDSVKQGNNLLAFSTPTGYLSITLFLPYLRTTQSHLIFFIIV